MGDSMSWAYDQVREAEYAVEEEARKTPQRLVSNIHRLADLAQKFRVLRETLGTPLSGADKDLIELMLKLSLADLPK